MTVAAHSNIAAVTSGIDVNDKPKRKHAVAETIPELPWHTKRIVSIGVAFAGLCAAALSAPTLFNLARLGHVPPYLAWLLPACLDGYAITSIQFGNGVPANHPAHDAAKRNARHALLLSVGGNFAYHVMVLAGSMLPVWMPIALLVVILSLPPFIVDRLLHLHSLASGTGDAAAAQAAPQPGIKPAPKTAPAPAAPAPAAAPSPAAAPASGGTRVPAPNSGTGIAPSAAAPIPAPQAAPAGDRRSPEEWAVLALPLWQTYVGRHGDKPTAPVLANLLRNAHPALKTGESERWERGIRAKTEALAETSL